MLLTGLKRVSAIFAMAFAHFSHAGTGIKPDYALKLNLSALLSHYRQELAFEYRIAPHLFMQTSAGHGNTGIPSLWNHENTWDITQGIKLFRKDTGKGVYLGSCLGYRWGTYATNSRDEQTVRLTTTRVKLLQPGISAGCRFNFRRILVDLHLAAGMSFFIQADEVYNRFPGICYDERIMQGNIGFHFQYSGVQVGYVF